MSAQSSLRAAVAASSAQCSDFSSAPHELSVEFESLLLAANAVEADDSTATTPSPDCSPVEKLKSVSAIPAVAGPTRCLTKQTAPAAAAVAAHWLDRLLSSVLKEAPVDSAEAPAAAPSTASTNTVPEEQMHANLSLLRQAERMQAVLPLLQTRVTQQLQRTFHTLDESMETLTKTTAANSVPCMQHAVAYKNQLLQTKAALSAAQQLLQRSPLFLPGESYFKRVAVLQALRIHIERCRRVLLDLHQWDYRVREIELLLHAYQQQQTLKQQPTGEFAGDPQNGKPDNRHPHPQGAAPTARGASESSSQQVSQPPLLRQNNGSHVCEQSLTAAATHAAALRDALSVLKQFPQFQEHVTAAQLLQRRILSCARQLLLDGLSLNKEASAQEQQKPHAERVLRVAAQVYVQLRACCEVLLKQHLPRGFQQPLLQQRWHLLWAQTPAGAGDEDFDASSSEQSSNVLFVEDISKNSSAVQLSTTYCSAPYGGRRKSEEHQKPVVFGSDAVRIGEFDALLTFCEFISTFIETRALPLKLLAEALTKEEAQQKHSEFCSSNSKKGVEGLHDTTLRDHTMTGSAAGAEEKEKQQARQKWQQRLLVACLKAAATVPVEALTHFLSRRCEQPLAAIRAALPKAPPILFEDKVEKSEKAAIPIEQRAEKLGNKAAQTTAAGACRISSATGQQAALASNTEQTATTTTTKASAPDETAKPLSLRPPPSQSLPNEAAQLLLLHNAKTSSSERQTIDDEVKENEQKSTSKELVVAAGGVVSYYSKFPIAQGKVWLLQQTRQHATATVEKALEICDAAFQTWDILLTLLCATPLVAENNLSLSQLANDTFFFPNSLVRIGCSAVYVHFSLAALQESQLFLPISTQLAPSQVVVELETRIDSMMERVVRVSSCFPQQQQGLCRALFAPVCLAAADAAVSTFFASLFSPLLTFVETVGHQTRKLHEQQLKAFQQQQQQQSALDSFIFEEVKMKEQQEAEEAEELPCMQQLPTSVPFSLPLLTSCVQLNLLFLNLTPKLEHMASSLFDCFSKVAGRKSRFDGFLHALLQLHPDLLTSTDEEPSTEALRLSAAVLCPSGSTAVTAIGPASVSAVLPRSWGVQKLQQAMTAAIVLRCCCMPITRFLSHFYSPVLLLAFLQQSHASSEEEPLPSSVITAVGDLVLQLLPHVAEIDDKAAAQSTETQQEHHQVSIQQATLRRTPPSSPLIIQRLIAEIAVATAQSVLVVTAKKRNSYTRMQKEKKPQDSYKETTIYENHNEEKQELLSSVAVLLQLHADISYLCRLSSSLGVCAAFAANNLLQQHHQAENLEAEISAKAEISNSTLLVRRSAATAADAEALSGTEPQESKKQQPELDDEEAQKQQKQHEERSQHKVEQQQKEKLCFILSAHGGRALGVLLLAVETAVFFLKKEQKQKLLTASVDSSKGSSSAEQIEESEAEQHLVKQMLLKQARAVLHQDASQRSYNHNKDSSTSSRTSSADSSSDTSVSTSSSKSKLCTTSRMHSDEEEHDLLKTPYSSEEEALIAMAVAGDEKLRFVWLLVEKLLCSH